jgi:hypothetical protein
MSRYRDFCESLRVGKVRCEEEQFLREEEEHSLPSTAGAVVRRMCQSFQCPAEQVRYIDGRSGLPTGTLDSLPLLLHDPTSGRQGFDVEIKLANGPAEDRQAIWLHLECAPLRHGGIEFHFGPEHFHLPDEEEALFDHIAEVINQELRRGYIPGTRRLGCHAEVSGAEGPA